MDKDQLALIVGELYLTNQLLTRKIEEKEKELEKLRKLIGELGGGSGLLAKLDN